MINEMTLKAMASCGNAPFLVLFENKIMKFNHDGRDRSVYCKVVSFKGEMLVKFGYYVNVDGYSRFIEIEVFNDYLEMRLGNPNLAGINFASVIDLFNDNDVEVNPTLRVINYRRGIFKRLAKQIYVDGVSTSITAGSLTLSLTDINNLYSYFETLFVNGYREMLVDKVNGYLQRSANKVLKTYLSFKKFIPVLYSGNCIVNPLLSSYKIKKSFMETDLFKNAEKSAFRISESDTVYLLTEREICESLKLDKYLRFTNIQLTFFLLGLFNGEKYPSTKVRVSLNENNRIVPDDSADAVKSASTLYVMCLAHCPRICAPSQLDKYISILSTAKL